MSEKLSKSEIHKQIKSSVIKLIIDISKIKEDVIKKNELDESDTDLQFLLITIDRYSKLKKVTYGKELDHNCEIKPNISHLLENMRKNNQFRNETESSSSRNESEGGLSLTKFNLQNFFSNNSNENKSNENDEVESSDGKYTDTSSEYEQYTKDDELNEIVDNKMRDAMYDLNRSISSKGIKIGHNIMENIELLDGEEVVREYRKRIVEDVSEIDETERKEIDDKLKDIFECVEKNIRIHEEIGNVVNEMVDKIVDEIEEKKMIGINEESPENNFSLITV